MEEQQGQPKQPRTRREFTKEFKRDAVELVRMPSQQRGRLHQEPAPDRPGSRRERPASTARSAQSHRGRVTCRRSTATSCRNTSSSASLVAERRASSTSHPSS
jgi:hypothetical protein